MISLNTDSTDKETKSFFKLSDSLNLAQQIDDGDGNMFEYLRPETSILPTTL